MMKTFLTILSYLPLLIVGGLVCVVIRIEEYMDVSLKAFACIGVFAIFYFLYKFTGYLHRKIDERYSSKELEAKEPKINKKTVLVYGGMFEYGAHIAMNKYVKELIDSGVEVLCVNTKDLYFETSKVEVQFVTKEMDYIGRRCDEAFGFNDLTTAYLTRNFRTYGWTGSLVDYILIQENR